VTNLSLGLNVPASNIEASETEIYARGQLSQTVLGRRECNLVALTDLGVGQFVAGESV
jgi:hypothetical protein